MQHWMTWQEVLSQAYEYEEKAARQIKRQNSNRQAIPAPVIVKSTNPGYGFSYFFSRLLKMMINHCT